jgi:Resolvase, N terminal domain
VLDEFNRFGIEFVSFRESIDTGGPLGRAIVVIIGAIAELERNLIVERVRAGIRRARLEGRQIGSGLWNRRVCAHSSLDPGDSLQQIQGYLRHTPFLCVPNGQSLEPTGSTCFPQDPELF